MTELEILVNDIKQGKRALLFPPGISYLALTVVFSMIGFVFLIGPVINIFAPEAPTSVIAVAQLASLGLPMGGVVLPGVMIITGRKQFASLLRSFIIGLAIAACALAAFSFYIQQMEYVAGMAISLSFLGGALWMSTRGKFLLLCEFLFLLKRPDQRK